MKRLLAAALGGILMPPALLAPLLLLENCCLTLLERLDKIPWLVALGYLYLGLFMFPLSLTRTVRTKVGQPRPKRAHDPHGYSHLGNRN